MNLKKEKTNLRRILSKNKNVDRTQKSLKETYQLQINKISVRIKCMQDYI